MSRSLRTFLQYWFSEAWNRRRFRPDRSSHPARRSRYKTVIMNLALNENSETRYFTLLNNGGKGETLLNFNEKIIIEMIVIIIYPTTCNYFSLYYCFNVK